MKKNKQEEEGDFYEEPVKTYSCLTEEEYDKAKDQLTEEEKKLITDLHELFKDYL